MQLTITINLDNAAFEENMNEEVSCCLVDFTQAFVYANEGIIQDSNGNTCGSFAVTE